MLTQRRSVVSDMGVTANKRASIPQSQPSTHLPDVVQSAEEPEETPSFEDFQRRKLSLRERIKQMKFNKAMQAVQAVKRMRNVQKKTVTKNEQKAAKDDGAKKLLVSHSQPNLRTNPTQSKLDA